MNAISRIAVATIIAGLCTLASAATNIQDPSGKTVLVVDHDSVKTDPAGKAVLTIDGDKITDSSGKLVLYINGDNIRNEPNGKLLLFIDGRHIKREPGGTNLLYVDGKDLMRGDRSGKPLYHFAGDDLTSQQRMAVLYVLMPELFKGDKEGDAKLVADQAKAATGEDADALKNFAPGAYTIDIYHSQDATNYRGAVTIAKMGDVFAVDFKFNQGDPLQGVGVQRGDELWIAVGPANTVGLAVYTIAGGKLTGTWYNASGKPDTFGSENLTGSETLGGSYKITDAKAPITHAAYTGTLTVDSTGKKFDGGVPIYTTAWDLGGYKAKGVGFAAQKSLAVATSTAPEFFIMHLKISPKDGLLNGQSFSMGSSAGFWSLKKNK
jgi:hypothetical protein